ncbi:ribose transport system ATP-binding protein [Novosphingobium sp. SG720]|nr:ribose transport system ATP-binding protein [Novosphingobium sp. SG720]
MVSASPLLALRHIAKRYPNGTQALVDASLEIHAGAVHGLLGANGAGKSTLIAILSGATAATQGEIVWQGQPVRWRRPADARRSGVSTLYQHIPLVPTLSALENILLDAPGWQRHDRDQRARARAVVAQLGDPFALDALVAHLPISARQMVGIAQSLLGGAQVLVMDEPTASLGASDRAAVYDVVRRLAYQEGKAIVFVSHFLDEILALTDHVTILRDGCDVLHRATGDLDEASLAATISGRDVAMLARRQRQVGTEVRLAVRDLASPAGLSPTTFDLRAGEILGIAGMLGAGRSELLHAVFGADPQARGQVLVDGVPVVAETGAAVAAGLALVPEDRKRQGFVAGFSIADNIALPGTGWRIDRAAERQRADHAIATLGIKADDAQRPVGTLSGGNAQKVVLAKWLTPQTRVLLLDEPTAGIDIGARIDILEQVRRLADQGLAVVLVSSDFAELLALSDRILVMRDGAVVACADPARTSEIDLTLLASGSAPPCDGAPA